MAFNRLLTRNTHTLFFFANNKICNLFCELIYATHPLLQKKNNKKWVTFIQFACACVEYKKNVNFNEC